MPSVKDCPVLRVHLRVMAQATESPDRVMQALVLASGSDPEGIAVTRAEGHFGNPIIIMEAVMDGRRAVGGFLGRLEDAGILAAIARTAKERVDDDCVLHLRLDKQAAYLGELKLAAGRDVIDVAMKIASYPADPGRARAAVVDWLDSMV